MVEHETCIGCQWNNYPTCRGTIMEDGNEMNITQLRPIFTCGQKDLLNITDFSGYISEFKLLKDRLDRFIIGLN